MSGKSGPSTARRTDPRQQEPLAVSQPDLSELVQKAQAVQQRLADVQRELQQRSVEGSAGGGMVTATVTGGMRVVSIAIEPGLIESGDPQMIQDLTAAAVNAALSNAQRMMQEELQRASGDLGIPNFLAPPTGPL